MNESPYRVPGERGPDPESLDWTNLKEIESIEGERTVFNGVRLSKTGLYYSFKWDGRDGRRPGQGAVVICRKDGARLKTYQVIGLEEYYPDSPIVDEKENGDLWIIGNDEKLVYKYEHDEYVFKEKAKFSPASKFVFRDGVSYGLPVDGADGAVLSTWQEGDRTLSLDQVFGKDLTMNDYTSVIKDRFDSKHLLVFLDKTNEGKSFKVVEMGEVAKILERYDIGPDDSLKGTAQLRNGDLVVGNTVWRRKPDGLFEMSQRLSYGDHMASFVIETTDGHLVSAIDHKIVIWEKESGSEEYKICNVISNLRDASSKNVFSTERVMEILPGMIAVTGRGGVVRVFSAS